MAIRTGTEKNSFSLRKVQFYECTFTLEISFMSDISVQITSDAANTNASNYGSVVH